MYELVQVGDHSYYVNSPAKTGLYVDADSQVYLIDSGNDKDAGKKILKIITEQGWALKAIINTHFHADHVGGNLLLQQRTGVCAYAYGMEVPFVQYPNLEPCLLYGGLPPKPLRNKFLMATPSEVRNLEKLDLPKGMEIFPLLGHCLDMIGVKTPDGVYFMADCVSSPAVLEKYQISYLWDVAEYLKTLDTVEHMEGRCFVPAHADVVESMAELCAVNRNSVFQVRAFLLQLCQEPHSFEEILQGTFAHYGMEMNWNQYALIGSTLRSYLSYLLDGGLMATQFVDNRLLWQTV